MTDEEYREWCFRPLSDEEKKVLTDKGWVFLSEDYMEIPNDYDGCMAASIQSIRKVLLISLHPDLYFKHRGHVRDILSDIADRSRESV